MNDFWIYLAILLIGFILGLIVMVQLLKGKISNNQIDIKKPKMKHNTDSTQQFTSDISGEPAKEKKKFKLFKRKRNGNI